MWSSYYDPFILSNYYGGDRSVISSSVAVFRHAARRAVDCLGNIVDRGDWIGGYFRAVEFSEDPT